MSFKNVWRPERADIEKFLEEIKDRAEWRGRMLGNISKLLTDQPLRYRSYGPYWWPLKKMLVESGETRFGIELDQEWIEALGYGDDDINLMAAHVYSDQRFEQGAMFAAEHEMELRHDDEAGTEEGDAIVFVSADEAMEIRSYHPVRDQ